MQTGSIPDAQARPRRWSLRRLVLGIPIILADEYAILLALFLLAKLLVGEQWEIVAFVDSFLVLLLLPTLMLFPVALARRRWSIALILLPAVLFFLISYGIFFLPRPASAATPPGLQIKILTYNIHSEADALDPVITLIRDSGADIVALQEVSTKAAERFAQEFAAQYPYQALHAVADDPIIGQGIFSRYPLLSDEYWRNERLPVKLGHLEVQIEADGTRFVLYNAHPIHPILKEGHLFYTDLRSQEIDSVLERASRNTGPVIIVGDFNMTDQCDSYRRITASFTDTYREVGWGLGFTFPDFSSGSVALGGIRLPSIPPVVRLDYIFHNSAVHGLEARVWPTSGGSDHRPVFARLFIGK